MIDIKTFNWQYKRDGLRPWEIEENDGKIILRSEHRIFEDFYLPVEIRFPVDEPEEFLISIDDKTMTMMKAYGLDGTIVDKLNGIMNEYINDLGRQNEHQ